MKSRGRAAYRKFIKPYLDAGRPLPDLNEITFANAHHKTVIQMTGVGAALNGVQLAHANIDDPANETDIAQAADAAIPVPDADQLLAQFMLHGAEPLLTLP
ncbi:uncharacterized protein LOC113215856 [Frankliniella occidentalis]|uniref:Uncharacterized protein LOC113215856 n=1 Tax=Frankliniella occidentalis TaxID=133901 RepID=A0A6J1TKF4_FRAOC|nr:uncharacterized protein LOC113215856 [Frankliniella occidentalis]